MANPSGCGVIKYSCCGAMPEELIVSVSGTLQACPCIQGDLRIVYAPSYGKWIGKHVFTNCNGIDEVTVTFEVYCLTYSPGDDRWWVNLTVASDACSVASYSGLEALLMQCDPFVITAGTLWVNTGCCNIDGISNESLGVVVSAPT